MEVITETTKVTLHAAPLAVNLISYSLLLRGFMKYVHNRPIPENMTPYQRNMERIYRRRLLAGFVLFGAPITYGFIRLSAPSFKDIISISLFDGNVMQGSPSQSNSFLLLLFNKIKNTASQPSWLKFIFNLLFLSVIFFKLLGYNLIDILIDITILKYIKPESLYN